MQSLQEHLPQTIALPKVPPTLTRPGGVTVVIPTYNEADNLAGMIAELLVLGLDDLRIIIIDDNSPDGTGDIADDLAHHHPQHIGVVHRPGKQGLGSAYRVGFRLALEGGADYIIQMDADFSHSPAYIPYMLDKIPYHDVVVGSRYVAGGGIDNRWNRRRRILSWSGNVYTRTITGLQVHDTTAGFKIFRRVVLESIDLNAIHSDGYAFQIEMAYLCQQAGYRVCEVPIFFEERAIGNSKMSLTIILEAIWRVWQLRLRSQ